ncbi:hypothetical protein V1505DRAFT_424508 [Lipomyces doorenjongii]
MASTEFSACKTRRPARVSSSVPPLPYPGLSLRFQNVVKGVQAEKYWTVQRNHCLYRLQVHQSQSRAQWRRSACSACSVVFFFYSTLTHGSATAEGRNVAIASQRTLNVFIRWARTSEGWFSALPSPLSARTDRHDRLSLKKVIETCDERIRQLENHILSLGGKIPPASSAQTEELLLDLRSSVCQSPGKAPELPDAILFPQAAVDNIEAVPEHEAANVSTPPPDQIIYPDSGLWGSGDNPSPQVPASASQIDAGSKSNFEMPFIEDFHTLGSEAIDWPWDCSEEDGMMQFMPDPQHFIDFRTHAVKPQSGNAQSTTLELGDDEALYDGSDSEIIEQLSMRLGDLLIVDDGSLRYLGVTSNMTLSQDWAFHDMRMWRRRASSQSRESKSALTLDGPFYHHLLDLYFHWQNPFLHVVDREVFMNGAMQAAEGKCSTFYSEALKFSLAAMAISFDSTTSVESPSSTAQRYVDHALSLLEEEFDSPKIATVQSLAILSCYEAINTRDARGWLYAGPS